jgi:hypothetical protein
MGCHSHYKPHATEEPVRRVPQHRTVRCVNRNWARRWKRQNANRHADERKRPHENSSTSCQREGVDVGPCVYGSAHRSDAERYLRETPTVASSTIRVTQMRKQSTRSEPHTHTHTHIQYNSLDHVHPEHTKGLASCTRTPESISQYVMSSRTLRISTQNTATILRYARGVSGSVSRYVMSSMTQRMSTAQQ